MQHRGADVGHFPPATIPSGNPANIQLGRRHVQTVRSTRSAECLSTQTVYHTKGERRFLSGLKPWRFHTAHSVSRVVAAAPPCLLTLRAQRPRGMVRASRSGPKRARHACAMTSVSGAVGLSKRSRSYAPSSRQRSSSGARATFFSLWRAPRPTCATCRTETRICQTAATSCSKIRRRSLPTSSSASPRGASPGRNDTALRRAPGEGRMRGTRDTRR
jgi:hypothetical protein